MVDQVSSQVYVDDVDLMPEGGGHNFDDVDSMPEGEITDLRILYSRNGALVLELVTANKSSQEIESTLRNAEEIRVYGWLMNEKVSYALLELTKKRLEPCPENFSPENPGLTEEEMANLAVRVEALYKDRKLHIDVRNRILGWQGGVYWQKSKEYVDWYLKQAPSCSSTS